MPCRTALTARALHLPPRRPTVVCVTVCGQLAAYVSSLLGQRVDAGCVKALAASTLPAPEDASDALSAAAFRRVMAALGEPPFSGSESWEGLTEWQLGLLLRHDWLRGDHPGDPRRKTPPSTSRRLRPPSARP